MYSDDFLFDEWSQVIEAFEVANLDAYTNLSRRGRLVRLNRKQRSEVWKIVDLATRLLKDHKLTPPFRQVRNVARQLTNGSLQQPFDYIIIDECQDLRHEHLVLLNAMRKTPQSLFFTGDLAQRIRQPLVSWLSAGINIAGRSYTLKVNYRTTQQIRSWADRLILKQFQDMDGVIEDRKYTISMFSGIPPEVRQYPSEEEEQLGISRWFEQVFESGVKPQECCLFIRSDTLFERARTVSQLVNCDHLFLDQGDTPAAGKIAIATMPNAEGLEFKAVAVMACDEWTIPLQSRLNGTMHDADTQAILDMERQLLYVAATRARDFLLITGTIPISRFLQEMR